MKKACLFLLAGLYAPQLSSFASHSDLFPLFMFAIVVGTMMRRLPEVTITAIGYALFIMAASQVINARISTEYVGDSIMADVRVADFPRHRNQTVSFIGEVRGSPWVPARVRISWFDPPEQMKIGDVWRLELRFRRPRGNSNPGAFDYEAWLFRNRIAATGYVVDSVRNEFLRTGDAGAVDALRLRIVERLRENVVKPERAAVLAAVSVGTRHLVSTDQWDRYAKTGTSHLMAISGLHVGMVAAAGYFATVIVAGLLRVRVNQHILATLISLACACVYAALSGLAVPAKRSVLMIGLSALAISRSRLLRPFTLIATAALVLPVLSPLSTLEPGFKLSFGAVLILIWIARRSTPRVSLTGRAGRAVSLLAAVQIALLLGLLPLTSLLFGRVALVAPVVNMVAVPVFSLATVPLTLCGLLFDGPLEQIGNQALRLASSSLGLVEWFIDLSLWFPGASLQIPQMSGWSLTTLFVPLAWVILPPGWPGRSIAWVALLAIIVYKPASPLSGCVQMDVLDVGQGLAVVVRTRSSTLLFDTGPAFRSGDDAATSVVLPYLAGQGISAINRLVVSHADLDHSGGVAAISRALQVDRLIAGEDIDVSLASSPCHAGTRWETDGVRFEFLYPAVGAGLEGNDASCVLQVSAGIYRVLLTGDIESPAEQALLQANFLQRTDVVIIPHHGSRTSSGPAFVTALSPKVAIVSAGFDNRWGLPDQEVVTRWQAAGAEVLNTAHDGAVRLSLCGHSGITSLESQRVRQRRIWHE